jgi:hypothetical protein
MYGCDGYGKMDTRLGMGARYYHIYDECCGDGKVDTRPGTGTSYYHQQGKAGEGRGVILTRCGTARCLCPHP